MLKLHDPALQEKAVNSLKKIKNNIKKIIAEN